MQQFLLDKLNTPKVFFNFKVQNEFLVKRKNLFLNMRAFKNELIDENNKSYLQKLKQKRVKQ
jgi:hypothetical protein